MSSKARSVAWSAICVGDLVGGRGDGARPRLPGRPAPLRARPRAAARAAPSRRATSAASSAARRSPACVALGPADGVPLGPCGRPGALGEPAEDGLGRLVAEHARRRRAGSRRRGAGRGARRRCAAGRASASDNELLLVAAAVDHELALLLELADLADDDCCASSTWVRRTAPSSSTSSSRVSAARVERLRGDLGAHRLADALERQGELAPR